MGGAPWFSVDAMNSNEVGRMIRECINESREGIPQPLSFDSIFSPILELAGLKSYGTFAKSARCVQVRAADDCNVVFTPTRNEGADGGFSPLPLKYQASIDSGAELGRVALQALNESE